MFREFRPTVKDGPKLARIWRLTLGDRLLGVFGAFDVVFSRRSCFIACYVDFLIEGRTIVECYCRLVPRLRQFKLSDDNLDEAINLAKKPATSFREIWCSPNDLLPYFHMCESEFERELRYIHTTHHVGIGAFVCQGVDAMGHQIKVACPSTGWCPKTFLAKLFGIIELRHASHEYVQ